MLKIIQFFHNQSVLWSVIINYMICMICKTLSDTDGHMENGSWISQTNCKTATNSKANVFTCRVCGPQQDRSWRSPAPCKHTRWVSWVRVMLSSIVQPVDHRVLDLVSGQRLDNLRDIPLHCGRPALVNIGSITRDRPALKKLRENGFQSFKTFSLISKKSTMMVVTAKVARSSSLL